LQLGDVARYAGAPGRARPLFRALVQRYPGDPLAADALFSLGRLEFEAGRRAAAAGWFERYLRDWPAGPLAEQAAVRLFEAAEDDPALARRAATEYLRRSPEGRSAARARALLESTTESAEPR
jgi:TolA-binding protein